MKEILEYFLLALGISLALMGNVVAWVMIYDDIKERIKNRKND